MNTTDLITRFVDALQSIPDHVIDCTDEPWERFSAEYQDWGDGDALLYVGYYQPAEGDLLPDPMVTVSLHDGGVKKITMTTILGTQHTLPGDPADDEYLAQFLSLVWSRHVANRVPAAA